MNNFKYEGIEAQPERQLRATRVCIAGADCACGWTAAQTCHNMQKPMQPESQPHT